jgi:hypothetical protein
MDCFFCCIEKATIRRFLWRFGAVELCESCAAGNSPSSNPKREQAPALQAPVPNSERQAVNDKCTKPKRAGN